MIRNNLSRSYYLIAEATPVMRDQAREGRSGGDAYTWGPPGQHRLDGGRDRQLRTGAYAASKGGLISLMRIAALDMARSGVTSNAIAPFARTRVTEIIQPANDEQAAYKERALKIEALHVANFAAWLCTEAAGDVTGQLFGVRGREAMLFSQARPQVTAVAEEDEWSMEALTQLIDGRFREHFADMQTDLEVFNTDPAV